MPQKQKTETQPHGVVLHNPSGVVYKGVNATCITVLYLALKFHKALSSLDKAPFTPQLYFIENNVHFCPLIHPCEIL